MHAPASPAALEHPDVLEAFAVPSGPGACATCHGPVWPPGTRHCRPCARRPPRADERGADLVVPVAIALGGTRLATAMWRYKAGPRPGREASAAGLTALLAAWLAVHRRCLLGVLEEPVVACVPARSGAGHLAALAAAAGLAPTASPWTFAAAAVGHPVLSAGAGLARLVEGRDVLVFDDTWTTGRTAQRAAVLAHAAGAARVAVLVLARHVSVGHPGGSAYLSRLCEPWQSGVCCLCAGAS